MVEVDQVAGRFGVDRRKAYRRLAALGGFGLVEHRRILHGRPGVYLATVRGLQAAGVALPAARVDLRSYDHDLALSGLCASYELAGVRVWTEREIRARDSFNDTPRLAVRLGEGGLHFPDLVVAEPGGLVAIEYERTTKRARRLDQILAAYLRARHLASVRYHVSDPRIASWIERAARRVRAGGFVEVLDPPDQSGEVLGRVASAVRV